MFTVQCLCKFRNAFSDVDDLQPFDNFALAVRWAIYVGTNRRTRARVVDYNGVVVWPPLGGG